MDQRSFALIMLFVVVLGFGGMILWDAKTNNRLGFGEDKQVSNWQWGDKWDGQVPNQPEPEDPKEEEIQKPDKQVVASTYADALAEAGKYGMPVFVYFEADWCSWCKKMKKDTLGDSKVQEIMKNYVLVYVNADQNRDLAKKFKVRALPSYAITNCNEEDIKRGEGYERANAFAKWLDNPSIYEQPRKKQSEVQPEVQPEPEPEPEERKPWRRPFRGRGSKVTYETP
jgi:thiol:disulfide interchange protein